MEKQQPIHRVGVVFIDCQRLARGATKYAILELNRIQHIFDFSVHDASEESLVTRPREIAGHAEYIARGRTFAESILAESREWIPQVVTPEPAQWVMITEVPLAGNMYLIESNRWWVLSLAHWDRFSAPPSVIEFILRIMQRVALDGVCSRKSHFTSKGCLYDFNAALSDAKYSVLNGDICPDCRFELEADCSPSALEAAFCMMDRTWLGSRDVPGTPASVLARMFDYDLYITTGLSPTKWNVFFSKFYETSAAEFAKYTVIAVVLIVLALIGALFHAQLSLKI
jgi:hypothetical protein